MKSKILTFFFLVFTSFAFTDNSLCDCDSCIYIRKQETCNTSAPPPPATCAYNAPVLTGVYCPWKATLQGSLIFLQASQENMQLALKTTSTSTNTVNSSVVETNWKYNSGYKIKAGFHVMHDSWDLMAGYFSFHNSYTTDVSMFQSYGMTPIFYDSSFAVPVVANSLHSKWNLDIDLLSAEIGRKYYVGRNLFIRSYFGAEGGWLDQDLLVNYLTTQTGTELTIPYDANSKSWCAGPKLGLQTEWETACFFRFLAEGSISSLFTQYKLEFIDQGINGTDLDPQISTNNTKFSNMNFIRPHLSLMFGIAWGNYVHCSRWLFDVTVGYQVDVFFNENPFGRPNNNIRNFSNGDLYLHGLIATASVDF